MCARERKGSVNPVNTGKLVEHALFARLTGTPPDPSVPGLEEFVRRVEARSRRLVWEQTGGQEPSTSDIESTMLFELGSGIEFEQKSREVLTRALRRANGFFVSQRRGTPGKEEGLRTVSARLDELNRPTGPTARR